jgi:hypothetical protein
VALVASIRSDWLVCPPLDHPLRLAFDVGFFGAPRIRLLDMVPSTIPLMLQNARANGNDAAAVCLPCHPPGGRGRLPQDPIALPQPDLVPGCDPRFE